MMMNNEVILGPVPMKNEGIYGVEGRDIID